MSTKTNLTTKVAAGAVLVALSGYVPNPAEAATANINASGSFITGVTLVAGDDLLFGTGVATQTTGTIQVDPGGATLAVSNGYLTVTGTPQDATIGYTVAAAGNLRLSIQAGIGTIAALAPGTASLARITMSSANVNGGNTFQFVATGATQAVAFGSTTGTLNIGGRITWTGGRPVGAYTQGVTVFVAY